MPYKFSELIDELEGNDQKSINFLSSAIEKNSLKGFDYIEFKKSLKAMQDMNLDSTTAIKSAFATASTMGLTKERLLHSIQHYKNVLSKEKSQFDDALKKQVDSRIRKKQPHIDVRQCKKTRFISSAFPNLRSYCRIMWLTRSGISSVLSRRGGMEMVNTFRRYQRSMRKHLF